MNAQLHREAAEDTNFRKQVVTDDHVRKVPFSLQIPKQKKGAILIKDTTRKEQPYNRNQKDQLFRLAFSEKKYQLDLYNAINGTNYTNPEDLEMTTLEDVIFLGMKNDLSFIIGTSMNLYEHQSSTNLNMPLRGLIYFSQLYQQYVRRYGYSLYAKSQIPLPFPNYIVFYNGLEDMPDEEELLLSNAFSKEMTDQLPAVECRVRLLNINNGHNKELLEKCQRLKEYSEFISSIREFLNQGMSIQDASHAALKQGIEKGLLSDLLSRCETEVFAMLLEEYDAEEVLRYREREAAKETEQLTLARDRKLFDLLLSQERYEDAKRAAKDPAYQLQLLSQYGI